jgi:hypothetical protein
MVNVCQSLKGFLQKAFLTARPKGKSVGQDVEFLLVIPVIYMALEYSLARAAHAGEAAEMGVLLLVTLAHS